MSIWTLLRVSSSQWTGVWSEAQCIFSSAAISRRRFYHDFSGFAAVHNCVRPCAPALDDEPVEEPLVASKHSYPNVSPSTLLNSTPQPWNWPQHPRLFLDICSGAGYPLSKVMMEYGCACFPIDILLSPAMDILDSSFYEPLLRICASGIISYGAGAPNCILD